MFRRRILSISIHAPRTGSDADRILSNMRQIISIHAPRTGSDITLLQMAIMYWISIHAPRTGSDAIEAADDLVEWAFQSTLPARGATGQPRRKEGTTIFQSTLPARGATQAGHTPGTGGHHISIHAPRTGSDDVPFSWAVNCPISIHAPRTGSDNAGKMGIYGWKNFNPRSPHGERPRAK